MSDSSVYACLRGRLLYGADLHPEEPELLPLGADLDLSKDVQAAKVGHTLRKQHNIADSPFVIFTGGKLAPAKRTKVLIEAFFSA